MKGVNKLLTTVLGNAKPKRTKGRGNRRGGNGRRTATQAMPAAYATHVQPRYSTRAISSTQMMVSGTDLVYQVPAELASNSSSLFCVIPANPCYWKGTRIAGLAQTYMNFRPLAFTVHYVPQVAVTQPGLVVMGTQFGNGAQTADLQQSLLTSNGGCTTQCYIPADCVVRCGSDHLQFNLFQINGSLADVRSNPFNFVATFAGGSVVPGYFYVSYRYLLSNPTGEHIDFYSGNLSTIAAQNTITQAYDNTSIVLTTSLTASNMSLGPGTNIDMEKNGENTSYVYNGTTLNLGTAVPVGFVYANRQTFPSTA